MSMDSKMLINEYRYVEISVRTRIDRKFQPLQNLPIEVFMKTDSSNILLSTIHSNEEGIAQMVIDKAYNYHKDDQGNYTLIAKFKGADSLKKASKKLKIRDLFIDADFTEENDVKRIDITAKEFIQDSLTSPEDGLKFEVFVDRMFSDLKLAEGEFKNGEASVNIPNDIPGDTKGNIKLFIMVDEREYQVVELSKTVNWGLPLVKDDNAKKNTASISYAIFMIISVIIIAIVGLFLSKTINNNKS